MIIIISTLGITIEDLSTARSTSSDPTTGRDELSTMHFKTIYNSRGGASTVGYSDTDVEREASSVRVETGAADGHADPDSEGTKPNLSAMWRLPS